jgi:hypothetical protein
LIATAKTLAEHERIANVYEERALEYLAQAQEHESMNAAYKENSSQSTDKNRTRSRGDCQHRVQMFRDMCVKSHEPGQLHKQMA